MAPALLAVLLLPAPLDAAVRPVTTFDLEAEDPELARARAELAELEERIRRREIPPVEFEFDRAVLKPYSKAALRMVADVLFRYPNLKLMVHGHTCEIGPDVYNEWLSQKRAEAVKDYLVRVGVMGESVRAKGYGEARPLHPNETEEGRRKNRRVEFHLLTRWWESVY